MALKMDDPIVRFRRRIYMAKRQRTYAVEGPALDLAPPYDLDFPRLVTDLWKNDSGILNREKAVLDVESAKLIFEYEEKSYDDNSMICLIGPKEAEILAFGVARRNAKTDPPNKTIMKAVAFKRAYPLWQKMQSGEADVAVWDDNRVPMFGFIKRTDEKLLISVFDSCRFSFFRLRVRSSTASLLR